MHVAADGQWRPLRHPVQPPHPLPGTLIMLPVPCLYQLPCVPGGTAAGAAPAGLPMGHVLGGASVATKLPLTRPLSSLVLLQT